MEAKQGIALFARTAGGSMSARRPAAAACFRALAGQLEGGADPAWWQAVARSWQGRFFPSAGHMASLLVSAIHFEALQGHELKRHFPTCGGKPGPDLEQKLAEFFASPSHGFLAAAAQRETANYSAYWSRSWTEPAALFFGRRKLPLVAVELNSIGGLGVCSDLLRPDRRFDSRLVTARVALAERPLNLAQDEDALWLKACYLPDDLDGAAAMERDAGRMKALLQDGDYGIQGAAVPAALASEFVAKRIPVEAESGLLLLSWNILTNLPPERQEAFAASAIAALSAWGHRGLWVALERERADPSIVDLRVYRMKNGKVEGRRLASVRPRLESSDARFDTDAAAAAFLD